MKTILVPFLLLTTPLFAQANATAELMTYGDVLGGPCTATISGATPSTVCAVLPSFQNTGSNALIAQTGDPNDALAIGVDLASQGHYFTGMADANGNVSIPFTIPNVPTLVDRDIWFQALSKPGQGGVNEYDSFSNIRWFNLNFNNRWQSAGSDLPTAVANIGWDVLERGPNGNATKVFACGGGPALMTDVQTPYPCSDQTWIYDLNTGETTLLPATLNESRAFHATTVLQDGRVLVSGGVTYGGQKGNGDYFTKILNSAEIWDPATGVWTLLPPMNKYRAAQSASLLPDGRVLIAGGTEGSGAHELTDVADLLGSSLKQTEYLDPSTLTWSNGPNLPEPKAGHGCVTLADGRILMSGGITYTTIFGIRIPDFSNQASIYDPATGNFSNAGSIGIKRALFAETLLPSGEVAIFGGAGGDIFNVGPIKGCTLYDPATTSNSSLTPLLGDRAFGECVSIGGGKVVVIGGASGDLVDPIPNNNCWLFDVPNDTITSLADMPEDHAGGVVELMEDGTIYVGGGESNSGSSISTAISYTQ
ncbi:MAG: kelch repeat-containing protein [Planctomycetota bacterium]|jgi:hypothetical protein|nr:kelch repeat-containing protein [Planctomycetota bacterium]MDP6941882.1 kelch repeat-containing protein [Planctomycetota bacterium]